MSSELKMPFGKHKGTPVKDLPSDYLQWLGTIELRDPLLSEVKKALAWGPVPLQKTSGVAGSTPSGRSSSTVAPGPSPAASKGLLRGSQNREAPKPKRQWIPRPEDEDLSAYYSNGATEGIGF